MEAICINGSFPGEYLAFYAQNGVKTPNQDSIYNFRSVSRNSQGRYEVLLEEIINPEVPIKHPILGVSHKEPAWKISRFRLIDGTEITTDMMNVWQKEKQFTD
jgi:hypothetical protein